MVGRPRTIDRDKVLDAAEAVVTQTGAAGLSIDAVAKAAGITKGGVQYCFGTKEQMIQAMIRRWAEAFEKEVITLADSDPAPAAIIRAHIAASRPINKAEDSRAAVMMAALLQSPEQVTETRAWYNSRMAGIDPASPEGRRLRLAFLAAEGSFFLRAFDLIDFDEATWKSVFDDILDLANDSPDAAFDTAHGGGT